MLYDSFELVRVTDMRGVDLARWRFDFDLTFAALAGHADGTVYHRYGGRPWNDPDEWLSVTSFRRMLTASLARHAEHELARTEDARQRPGAPKPAPVESSPSYRGSPESSKDQCVHCHQLYRYELADARADGSFEPDDIWKYPAPERIGLELALDDPTRIEGVVPDSPADAAGVAVGSRIATLGGVPVASFADVQWVLENLPNGACELALTCVDETHDPAPLELADGWKRGTALEFSWRPLKFELKPALGFGGRALTSAEIAKLSPRNVTFAFEVTYLVTWGRNQRFGREAARAGLREGDIVLALGGRSDFQTPDHVHAWWRLERTPGEHVDIEILRDGELRTISIEVLH